MQPGNNPQPKAAAMFSAKQIKEMARLKIKGKWREAIPVFIVYVLLTNIPAILAALMGSSAPFTISPEAVISADPAAAVEVASGGVAASVLTSLYGIFALSAFTISMSVLSLKIIRDEKFSVKTLFSGFSNYKQSLCTYLLVALYSMLWTLICLAPSMLVMGIAALMNSNFVMYIGFFVMVAGIVKAIMTVMKYQMSYYVAADNRNMKASFTLANSTRLMQTNVGNYIWLMLTFIGWYILAAVPDLICASLFAHFIKSGGVLFLAAAVLMMIVAVIASSALMIYVNTSVAVFYSAASGFFRTRGEDDPDPKPYTTLTPENIVSEINNMQNGQNKL